MKKVIDRSIDGGLFKEKITNRENIVIKQNLEPRESSSEIWELWEETGFAMDSIFLGTVADFVFTTDLVECLVQYTETCGQCLKSSDTNCNGYFCYRDLEYVKESDSCKNYEDGEGIHSPQYHRSIMANMTLPEMKKYLRKLAREGKWIIQVK
jgi:hypothetical protein